MSAPLAAAAPAPLVVKLGGRALDGPAAYGELAAELAAQAHDTVLVHGGGEEVTRWSRRLGQEARFVDGLRVTDGAVLEVAVAVLAGLANKRLVATLRAAGVNAVGLAALDGGAVETEPHADAARLGEVGEIRSAPAELVRILLAAGYAPVLASIGASDGRLLNVNADELAGALAASLGARELVLLSDTPGLILGGALVPALVADDIEALLGHPEVGGGMRPKLRAAAAALTAGAARVHIAAWQGPGTLSRLLCGEGTGTALYPGSEPAGATLGPAVDGTGLGATPLPFPDWA